MALEFDQELDQLRIGALHMFHTTREAVENALRAVRTRDQELSQEVIDGDGCIDRLESRLEAQGLRLLALKQPVARDLRAIMGSTRIASNLERIADEAANIAKRNIILLDLPPTREIPSFTQLSETCLELFDKATQAYTNNSLELAQEVRLAHELIANLHMRAFRDLTDTMIREPHAVERIVQLSFVAYSLKRICDRFSNIAESVIFIVEGLDVKHGFATRPNRDEESAQGRAS